MTSQSGNGLPMGYVDVDVYESSRAFTGWSVSYNTYRGDDNSGEFLYRNEDHDRHQKTVLGMACICVGARARNAYVVRQTRRMHVYCVIAAEKSAKSKVAWGAWRRLRKKTTEAAPLLIDAWGEERTEKQEETLLGVLRTIGGKPKFVTLPFVTLKLNWIFAKLPEEN